MIYFVLILYTSKNGYGVLYAGFIDKYGLKSSDERFVFYHRWVQDNKTGKMMGDNTWLFAGSAFAEYEGKQIYHADINGSAISLVNFGDDLLTLPNEMTQDNDSHGQVWAPLTASIPEVGTEVLIRLRVEQPEPQPDQAAEGD